MVNGGKPSAFKGCWNLRCRRWCSVSAIGFRVQGLGFRVAISFGSFSLVLVTVRGKDLCRIMQNI